MRLSYLFALTLGAVGLLAVAPQSAQACWFGHGGGWGMGYGGGGCCGYGGGWGMGYGGGWGYGGARYMAPGPAYSAPGPAYYPSGSVYAAPRYYAPPGPAMAPGMVPGTMQPGTIRMMPGAGSPVPMPATTSATVSAKDNTFDPPTLNVQPGTTVRWTNTGAHPHTVTDRGGKFDSGDIAPGASYTTTFTTPGTYRYYCKHHKGMEGTIVVGESGKGPAGGTGPAPGGGSKGPSY